MAGVPKSMAVSLARLCALSILLACAGEECGCESTGGAVELQERRGRGLLSFLPERRRQWSGSVRREAAPKEEAGRNDWSWKKQSKNSNFVLVAMGTLMSALAVSLRQSIGSVVQRTKTVVERQIWISVEVCEADDPKLFKAMIHWLHGRDMLQSGSFKAMSTTAIEQKPGRENGRKGSTVGPSLLKGDDVVMVPMSSKNVSASFRDGRGRTCWVRLAGPPSDEAGGEAGLRTMIGGMRPGPQKRAAKAAIRSGAAPAKLSLSTLNNGPKPLEALREVLRTALREADLAERTYVQVYELQSPTPNQGARWSVSTLVRKRPPSSVILKRGVMEAVLEDVQRFVADEDWYVARSLAHRRGYLLHGPPGTGKSSLVLSVCSYFGWPLCLVSLPRLGSTPLSDAVALAPPSSVVVVEDVDVAFDIGAVSRDAAAAQHTVAAPPNTAAATSASLQELLNALDGPCAADGRIVFLTTNRADSLDKALIRPGRCDRVFRLGLADRDMAARLFKTFYDDFDPQTTGPPPNGNNRDPASTPSPQNDHIEGLAARYGAVVGDDRFSMAALQGHLLLHRADPHAALASAESGDVATAQLQRPSDSNTTSHSQKHHTTTPHATTQE